MLGCCKPCGASGTPPPTTRRECAASFFANRRGGFHIRPWGVAAAATSTAAWGHAALRITIGLDVGRGALTPP